MVSLISASGRLGWMPSLPRESWRKHYSGGRKISRHEGRNFAGVRWESLDGYSVLLGRWSIGWVFYRENNILVVRTTSGSLFKEVVGKLIDSKASSLSSPHAWRVHLSSLTLQNFFIINDLDKREVKTEDEDQTLLLLYSLPSSYMSFKEAIIYGGKLAI